GCADLSDFLPPTEHPLYHPVLQELIRVDLEYGWARGRPTTLDEYRRRFPLLFQSPQAVREIAFEEYRLRLLARPEPSALEYADKSGVDVGDRPALLLPGVSSSPHSGQDTSSLPRNGSANPGTVSRPVPHFQLYAGEERDVPGNSLDVSIDPDHEL